MCDGILIDLPATVFNDRFDITGNNNDSTFKETVSSYDTEGNPNDPCNDDYHVCFLAMMHTVNKFKSYINKNFGYDIPLNDLTKPMKMINKHTKSHNL
jgi:hypothetical protein